jgi:hypothetical protein
MRLINKSRPKGGTSLADLPSLKHRNLEKPSEAAATYTHTNESTTTVTMFTAAHRAAKQIIKGNKLDDIELPTIASQCISSATPS